MLYPQIVTISLDSWTIQQSLNTINQSSNQTVTTNTDSKWIFKRKAVYVSSIISVLVQVKKPFVLCSEMRVIVLRLSSRVRKAAIEAENNLIKCVAGSKRANTDLCKDNHALCEGAGVRVEIEGRPEGTHGLRKEVSGRPQR